MRTKKRPAHGGFTIVELLTVVSIIVLLLAMIIPGINYMKRIARELKVRAQIKGLCEGAEAFYSDNEFYPPSNRTRYGASPVYTCGAQKLAAALVGVDLHGYDPQGDLDLETCERNSKAYAIEGVGGATAADVQRSLDRRKEMYITPTPDMIAANLKALYGDGKTGTLYPGNNDPTVPTRKRGPVLCDAMKVVDVPSVENLDVMLRAGTPFLYFRANRDTRAYGESDRTYRNDGYIYNYMDNKDLLNLMPLSGATDNGGNLIANAWSPLSEDDAAVNADRRKAFYEAIINPAITTEARPYNMTTFIIISAGTDGVFGTKDDISNLGK